jgi:general secretion pathway protein C
MTTPRTLARWPAAMATVGIWALAAASAVFWGLRLNAPPGTVAPPSVAKAPLTPDGAAIAQVLGAVSNLPAPAAPEAPSPAAASRFALLGVVADANRQGAALIAIDGQPARPFKVGARLADGFVLQSVTTRSAALGASANGEPALTLQLPTRPAASTTAKPLVAAASASPALAPPQLKFGPASLPR